MPDQTLKDYVYCADENAVARFPELRFKRIDFQSWIGEITAMIEFLRDCDFSQDDINSIIDSQSSSLKIVIYWYERWKKQTGKQWEEMEDYLDDFTSSAERKPPKEPKPSEPSETKRLDENYLTFPSLHFVRTDFGEWSADKEALIAFLKGENYSDARIREITGSKVKSLDFINVWYAVYYKLSKNRCEALERVLEERNIVPIVEVTAQ
jgi:hypothetical protein